MVSRLEMEFYFGDVMCSSEMKIPWKIACSRVFSSSWEMGVNKIQHAWKTVCQDTGRKFVTLYLITLVDELCTPT